MMVYHEKISPPGPLSVLASEPSDVVLSQRTIESLEQENAWLKERLARIIRSRQLSRVLAPFHSISLVKGPFRFFEWRFWRRPPNGAI